MADESLRTLAYPVAGEAAERPLLACWLALLIAPVVPVVPLVPFLGYLVAVVDASADGRSAPPFVGDLRTAIGRGVLALATGLVYLGLPATLLLVTVYGATSAGGVPAAGNATATAAADGAVSGPERLLTYAASTIMLTLLLVGAYLWPVGLLAVGRDGGFRAAFAPGRLRAIAGHGAYFVGWTVGGVLAVVAVAVAAALAATGRPGFVVGALVLAYGAVLAAHVWGRALARAERF